MRLQFVLCALLIAVAPAVRASDLVEILPVTNRIVMLHFDDGYVDHYGLGEEEADDRIFQDPLDVQAAGIAASYAVSSADDPAYATARTPVRVGRKSKGSDFSTRWPDTPYVRDHWIYLVLPSPMQRGMSYRVQVGDLAANVDAIDLTYDELTTRSETVHVNQVGHVPSAPKYAYLSHWMGDLGPLILDDFADSQCHVVDSETNAIVYSNQIRVRKRLIDGIREVAQPGEAGNLTRADVWECEFSAFETPGRYRIVVDSIGASFPFSIGADVYREAFRTSARGLYHQRSGIALTAPYTEWTRPRDHHPAETDTVMLSAWRHMDGTNAFTQLPRDVTGEKRPYWGGWHDAGDWDRRAPHVGVSYVLLLVYELAPDHFSDGELNIPESGNGIPDIIDEARWGVDFFRRMQDPDGGIHGGLETTRHPRAGVSSDRDMDQWYAYAPDPQVSYHYAAVAAQLGYVLRMAGTDEEAEGYIESAVRAYDWASANMRPGDEEKVRDYRQLGAAWLFKVTGDAAYQDQFVADNRIQNATSDLIVHQQYDQDRAAWTYATTDQPGIDQALKARIRQAAIRWASTNNLETADRRAFRFGYNYWRPTLVGSLTTPDAQPLIVAHALTGDRKYLDAQYLAADFYLGANPLNMTWVTGLGTRHPEEVLHLDSWYLHDDKDMIPGITPYGPHYYTSATSYGPWGPEKGFASAYPRADTWPTQELWFENRYSPITNEYTVQESIAPAAAAYGYLTGRADQSSGGGEIGKHGFILNPAYPNPFTTQATLTYRLQDPQRVRLEIIDVLGRRVALVVDDQTPAGTHTAVLDAAGLSSGVYFARLLVGDQSDTRTLFLVR